MYDNFAGKSNISPIAIAQIATDSGITKQKVNSYINEPFSKENFVINNGSMKTLNFKSHSYPYSVGGSRAFFESIDPSASRTQINRQKVDLWSNSLASKENPGIDNDSIEISSLQTRCRPRHMREGIFIPKSVDHFNADHGMDFKEASSCPIEPLSKEISVIDGESTEILSCQTCWDTPFRSEPPNVDMKTMRVKKPLIMRQFNFQQYLANKQAIYDPILARIHRVNEDLKFLSNQYGDPSRPHMHDLSNLINIKTNSNDKILKLFDYHSNVPNERFQDLSLEFEDVGDHPDADISSDPHLLCVTSDEESTNDPHHKDAWLLDNAASICITGDMDNLEPDSLEYLAKPQAITGFMSDSPVMNFIVKGA